MCGWRDIKRLIFCQSRYQYMHGACGICYIIIIAYRLTVKNDNWHSQQNISRVLFSKIVSIYCASLWELFSGLLNTRYINLLCGLYGKIIILQRGDIKASEQSMSRHYHTPIRWLQCDPVKTWWIISGFNQDNNHTPLLARNIGVCCASCELKF